MILLAVETSSAAGGIELCSESKVLAQRTWLRENTRGDSPTRSHSELLTQAFSDCLEEAGIAADEINLITTSTGPGSFTGIRVGLNFVKTLSYSFDIPILPFNSLRVIAHSCKVSKLPLLVGVNAFRNMLFMGRYEYSQNSWRETTAPHLVKVDSLDRLATQPHLGLGDGWDYYQSMLSNTIKKTIDWQSQTNHFPDVSVLSRLALMEAKKTKTFNWKELAPLYLRLSSAEEKRREGILIPLPKLKN